MTTSLSLAAYSVAKNPKIKARLRTSGHNTVVVATVACLHGAIQIQLDILMQICELLK